MYEIPGEDERWEAWENKRVFDAWGGNSAYKSEKLFLYEEIEEIERERGYSMQELYEGDLLEKVEEHKGIIADSAEWNNADECIKYRYRVA